jgi:hypothetical protein
MKMNILVQKEYIMMQKNHRLPAKYSMKSSITKKIFLAFLLLVNIKLHMFQFFRLKTINVKNFCLVTIFIFR